MRNNQTPDLNAFRRAPRSTFVRSLALWLLVSGAVLAGPTEPASRGEPREPNLAPKVPRPANEAWSDGPTLLYKHMVATAKGPTGLPRMYDYSTRRLLAIDYASRRTITTVDDVRNYLRGAGERQGAIQTLEQKLPPGAKKGDIRREVLDQDRRLFNNALKSRDRLTKFLGEHGVDEAQRNHLAEAMLWRVLAYNSGTLAHGSFAAVAPGDVRRADLAYDGLNQAIAESFRLGKRLSAAAAGDQTQAFLRWTDMSKLHAVALKNFPEMDPGKVRKLNFNSPINSFGVHYPRLHGPNGTVHRLWQYLEPNPKGKDKRELFKHEPIGFMANVLYWLHNDHPFRDGNGRQEPLLGWPMAMAAGFPLPFEYDQNSGDFRLAAAKWGGSNRDLRRFIAKGALSSERFARELLPLVGKDRIVSSGSNQGAVSVVTQSATGERTLLVMFPVTHARKWDSELQLEAAKNRAVVTGETFNPHKIAIDLAIDGKHNPWTTYQPSAVHMWDRRYPWWTTVEPIYKIPLPQNAHYVDFKIRSPEGNAIRSADYYCNLDQYTDINAQLGGQ